MCRSVRGYRTDLLVGLLALVLLTSAVWLGVTGSGRGACGNLLLAEVPSPGGDEIALVFRRDCGATAGFSTQVSLLRRGGEVPGDVGNLFIADTDHGRAPSGPGGGPVVHVRWVDDHHLVLVHHPAARVFRAERQRGPLNVEYRAE
jgi:hypothetical protein